MTDPTRCPQCGTALPPGTPEQPCAACLLELGMQTWTSRQPSSGPSWKFDPPSVDELARLFDDLDVHELLGQGGMGAVYRVTQKRLQRTAALKVLPPDAAARDGFTERFEREARTLAQLNHPHVVTIYDFGERGGFHFLLMEFVDGVNLRQALDAGELSAAEALEIVPQVCEALQFAHNQGIVHRDIKPENILLSGRGTVKVADFGLAKLLDRQSAPDSLTATGQVMGTAHYMAPEQLESPADVDHRADIYSLGVVMYEMLTGELPLGRFAPPSRKVAVDVRIDEVVLRTLEKAPEQRYQQASHVGARVRTIAGEPVVAVSDAPVAVTGDANNRRIGRWHRTSGYHPLQALMALGLAASLLFLVFPAPMIGFAELIGGQPLSETTARTLRVLLVIPIVLLATALTRRHERGGRAKPLSLSPGSRLHVQPMEHGFDTSIKAELIRQGVPVTVVNEVSEADLILAGRVTTTPRAAWHEGWFSESRDHVVAAVELADRQGRVLWAAEEGDRSVWRDPSRRRSEVAEGKRVTARRLVSDLRRSIQAGGVR